MKYITLGKTGIDVSVLGLGGHEYLTTGKSRGFNEDFTRSITPGQIFDGFGNENRIAVLKEAYDLGINFYDVTIDSEKEALGRNLKQIPPPHEIYIQTRPEGMCYTYDENNVKMLDLTLLRAEVQRILKMLQRETIDFFNLAPMKCAFTNDPNYMEKLGYNIAQLKKEGLIRFACADTFSGEKVYLDMIRSGYFDVAYMNFNFGYAQSTSNVLKTAQEQNMGVIAREAYMKGRLFQMAKEAGFTDTASLADAALRWCLAQDGLSNVVYGTGEVDYLRNAASAIMQPFTTEDMDLINKVKATTLYKEYEELKNIEFFKR